MSVHCLPLPARPAPADPTLARVPTYGVSDIARRVGQAHRSDGWVVNYIRVLMGHQGFPAPFPRLKGTTMLLGLDALCASARWDRRAVDAWLDGLLPPAVRQHEQDAAGDRLDDRADNLDTLLNDRRRA